VSDPGTRHRQVQANGIELHLAEAGEGKPVVLIHGFPELWYSWRHQMAALADAGYHVLAPDMRGYGGSSAPAGPDAYDVATLAADVAALLDDAGAERAAIVGHDWGANVAWHFALFHPERTACVAGISVPLVPRAPVPPLALMREHLGEDFYIVWFQEPGVADEALARDVRRTVLTPEVWNAKWAARDEDVRLPEWMTEEDAAVYVEEFSRTGFSGGLSWYRAIDRNWEVTESVAERTIDVPALFMIGTRDSTIKWMSPDATKDRIPQLRTVTVDGAGHWLQQQCPERVGEELKRLLEDADW
jgi:pimeloyl-ACP methyl ester carboxylesterase